MNPFRFLIGARGIQDRRTLVEGARAAEAVGYSDLTVHDHLTPQLAPIALLTAVAMATERLRLCPLVLNNDLRHPAVLAQELATIDVLSEGRLVVGIGAGWNEPEYRSIGLPFDPPAVRISRMLESVTILRGLFGDGPTSFDGRFYTIAELDGQPKPVQRPHPPFLIGGTRERMLRIAAREADIVGMDLRQDRESLGDAFPARMDERVRWVRDEAGSRFDEPGAQRPAAPRRDHHHERAAEGRGRRGARVRSANGPVDRSARRPRVAVLADRHRPGPGREAARGPGAVGDQLDPRWMARRAGSRGLRAGRRAARGDLARSGRRGGLRGIGRPCRRRPRARASGCPA